MYDKSDPRSKLAPQKQTGDGATAMPATYALYYEEDPVEDDVNGKAWYTRGQDLLVNYIEAAPGATFSRAGQKDEYMVVISDEDTPWEISAGGETKSGPGYQVVIVPPGDSEVILPQGGRLVRLFSTQSEDLNAKCSNRDIYAEPDPAIPPFQPWPDPVDGFKLRVYDLWSERRPGKMGPIYRCTTIMLNFPPPGGGPRDITKMSPHSHDDFDQCSLVLAGAFRHNMRWPWGLDKNHWRADEDPVVGSPSCTIIPARVIHSSESMAPPAGGNRMADIFAPPRLDFSLQEGWVQNADEYPLPEHARTAEPA